MLCGWNNGLVFWISYPIHDWPALPIVPDFSAEQHDGLGLPSLSLPYLSAQVQRAHGHTVPPPRVSHCYRLSGALKHVLKTKVRKSQI